MEQNNSTTVKKNSKKPKVMFFLFIIPILLLILLTVITVIGVYLVEQDTSGATSKLIGLATLGVCPSNHSKNNFSFLCSSHFRLASGNAF